MAQDGAPSSNQDFLLPPPMSAAEVLRQMVNERSARLPTRIDGLDRVLAGGVALGRVTEFWGPPGVGKTAVGIQLAATALVDGRAVVWVDCAHPLYFPRFTAVLDSISSGGGSGSDSGSSDTNVPSLGKFVHFAPPTLAHLIAILCRPQPWTLPPGVALIVVDALSALISSTLPRSRAGIMSKQEQQQRNEPWSAPVRRTQTLAYIANELDRLAATRNCAVVLLTQAATRIRSGRGTTLIPAVGDDSVWPQTVVSRVVLFRDWAWRRGGAVGLRFAAAQDIDGMERDPLGQPAAFEVLSTGVVNAPYDINIPPPALAVMAPRKRKLGQTDMEQVWDRQADGEEADSWDGGEDDALSPMPPQWQGSQDHLTGMQKESDEGAGTGGGCEAQGGEDRGGGRGGGDKGDDGKGAHDQEEGGQEKYDGGDDGHDTMGQGTTGLSH